MEPCVCSRYFQVATETVRMIQLYRKNGGPGIRTSGLKIQRIVIHLALNSLDG